MQFFESLKFLGFFGGGGDLVYWIGSGAAAPILMEENVYMDPSKKGLPLAKPILGHILT